MSHANQVHVDQLDQLDQLDHTDHRRPQRRPPASAVAGPLFALAVLTTTLLLLSIASTLGCGASPMSPLFPIPPPLADSCAFADVEVVPEDGAAPLPRALEIAVSWRGAADDVVFDVRANGKSIEGEAWVADGHALFLPYGVLPADSLVTWRVSACGRTESGAFATGALLRRVDDETLAQCVDVPFEVDLRRATLRAPTTNTGVGDAILKWRIAPALFAMVHAVNDSGITFWLVPGRVDEWGFVQPDRTRPARLVTGSVASNPYFALVTEDIALALDDGAVTLRGMDLLVGLDDPGYDERVALQDGRLVAEVDTRGWSTDDDPCSAIEAMTREKCYPCDARDIAGSCFLLEMTGVVGLPSDDAFDVVAPERGLVMPDPCDGRGAPCPSPVGDLGERAVERPDPLPLLVPCPDPRLCPEGPFDDSPRSRNGSTP